MKYFTTALLCALALGTTVPAFAAAPDVTAVVAEIAGLSTPVNSIGLAVLTVLVAISVWRIIRKPLP